MAETARGELFRRLRKERHWSQATAAHNVGVTDKTWRSWEKGGKIEYRNARRAARVFEVEPDQLIKIEEPDEADDLQAQFAELLEGQALLLSEMESLRRQLRALQGSQPPAVRKGRGSKN